MDKAQENMDSKIFYSSELDICITHTQWSQLIHRHTVFIEDWRLKKIQKENKSSNILELVSSSPCFSV